MKKVNFRLMTVLMSALMLVFMNSCKDDSNDDEEDTVTKPVLDENFFFTVDGNDISFTTTLSGTVWFWNCTTETQIDVTDGAASTSISTEGSYPFTCNTLISGETYASDTFYVDIETTDLSYLDEGLWLALTGGSASEGKTWVLDDFLSSEGNEYNKYFANALNYYQYFEDESEGTSWGPFGHNLYFGDWTTNFGEHTTDSTPEIGSITFDGVNLKATLKMDDGWDFESSSFTSFEEATTFVLTIQDDEYGYKSTLEESYGFELSDEWATLKFSAPVRMPMDKGRVSAGEFTYDDAGTIFNVTIVSCTDSALLVGIDRVYEVDGTSSEATLLYNFICSDYTYTYDDPDAFVAPDRPTTSGALEDGTYMLAEIPGYYYDWSSLALGDTWDDLDSYKSDMASWWCLGNPSNTVDDNGDFTDWGTQVWDSAYKAYSTQSIVVSGSNVTVTYKSINPWYSTADSCSTITTETMTTTFTQADGVITFADPINVYTPNAAISSQTELYIIPSVFDSGIAIGHDNINEDEKSYQTLMQNWIKQ